MSICDSRALRASKTPQTGSSVGYDHDQDSSLSQQGNQLHHPGYGMMNGLQ
jgi:hypothetical protein